MINQRESLFLSGLRLRRNWHKGAPQSSKANLRSLCSTIAINFARSARLTELAFKRTNKAPATTWLTSLTYNFGPDLPARSVELRFELGRRLRRLRQIDSMRINSRQADNTTSGRCSLARLLAYCHLRQATISAKKLEARCATLSPVCAIGSLERSALRRFALRASSQCSPCS